MGGCNFRRGSAVALRGFALRLGCGLACVLGLAGRANAQADHVAPSKAYHASFGEFYDGEYKAALDRFTLEGRSAMKFGQARWIDSICYETASAECYYQMGVYGKALAHYTAALEIYLAYPTWMVQVNFPPLRPDSNVHKTVPWATRQPQAPLGAYPQTMSITQGEIDVNAQIRRGGVIQQATMYQIEPQEIIRSTTLAIRRRAELLGPMAAHDTLFQDLIAALSRRPGPPNHWSEAWVNLELGLALAAGGREGQAVSVLQRATVAAGEYQHPLSSVAHFALGRLALLRGDYPVALQHFEEATYGAVYYPDAGMLEEAFRAAALTHLMSNRKGMYPPLLPALAWAKSNHLRQLYCSLLLLVADNDVVLGQTQRAGELVDEARLAIGRRQMGLGRMGARRNFLAATVFFQAKKPADGEAALAAAMNFLRDGSLWLFHISRVEEFCATSAAATARTALDLYQTVLRDPQPADWATDPMETLAVLMVPHSAAYEHWFEAAVARHEHELAVEVADRTRRHRFLSTLPMGGRLESLRWVLEAPKESLPAQALLQRQDLTTRYPGYEQLREKVRELRAKLAAMPLVSADAAAAKQQSQALSQLASWGHQQEAILHEMSVRREPAVMAFPPLRTTAEIQKLLPKGQALLIFFATSRALHAFLLDRSRYGDWQVATPPQTIARQTTTLLRALGNYQRNHELALKDLADAKWQPPARELLESLLKGSRADFTTKFDELIIVPDGVLWYVPFEALIVRADGQLQTLISRFRIRYAPTAALAVTPRGVGRRQGNTGVVLGRLSPHLDEEVTRTTFTELAKAISGCTALRPPLPAPASVFVGLLDRLVVLDDLAGADAAFYGGSSSPAERGEPSGTPTDPLVLPWGGPLEIVLPGFHTQAEESLKRLARVGPGNDVFLSICGLMARGASTILLSRWQTGGQTSLDLVREFTQELPHTVPADAWQRAVQVVAASRLNLDAEPRIKPAPTDDPPRAGHPFFWAGYLLVDSGAGESAEAQPPKPVLGGNRRGR